MNEKETKKVLTLPELNKLKENLEEIETELEVSLSQYKDNEKRLNYIKPIFVSNGDGEFNEYFQEGDGVREALMNLEEDISNIEEEQIEYVALQSEYKKLKKEIYIETVAIIEKIANSDYYYVVSTNHKVNASTNKVDVPFAYLVNSFLKLNNKTVPFIDEIKEETTSKSSNIPNISSVSINTIYDIDVYENKNSALIGMLQTLQEKEIKLESQHNIYIVKRIIANQNSNLKFTQLMYLLELAKEEDIKITATGLENLTQNNPYITDGQREEITTLLSISHTDKTSSPSIKK